MNSTSFLNLTICLTAVLSASLFAEDAVPEGLSQTDWSSIREAYEAGWHGVHRQEDGRHTAHNPGQQGTPSTSGSSTPTAAWNKAGRSRGARAACPP